MNILAANNEDAIFGVAFLGIMCASLVIGLGIQAVICWYLSNCLKAIPQEHRKQEPGMVWLLMIPLFSIVWNFFVYPRISESYKSYFDSIGRTDVGDCGRSLAFTFCILCCCTIIPYLGGCVGIAALVIWIILLVKYSTLKGQITNPSGGSYPVSQTPNP